VTVPLLLCSGISRFESVTSALYVWFVGQPSQQWHQATVTIVATLQVRVGTRQPLAPMGHSAVRLVRGAAQWHQATVTIVATLQVRVGTRQPLAPMGHSAVRLVRAPA
jgi:hypothetical protein